MKFEDAQKDMELSYYGGGVGVLVSSRNTPALPLFFAYAVKGLSVDKQMHHDT